MAEALPVASAGFSPNAMARAGAGFVYFEPYGGLANRIRVLASFAALARSLKEPVGFHWIHGPGKQVGAPFEDLFEPIDGVPHIEERWQAVDQVLDLRSRNPLRRWRRQVRNRALGVDLMVRDWDAPGVRVDRALQRLGRLSPEARVLVHTCYSFGNYRPHLQDLRPVSGIQERLDLLARRYGFGPDSVGVHVRRTDNELARRHSPLSAFQEAMEQELRLKPDTWFFLCTDEPELEGVMEERFPGRVVVLEKDHSRENASGMEAAMIDLYLLARTRKVLGSYSSSFSQIASEIGGIPLDVIEDGAAPSVTKP
jgi:hypothetical protein